MLFSSLPFLFYFLPCALGLYFLVPGRLKNAALLLCSLVFYAWGEPRFVLFMAAAILQGYAAARLMERYPTRRRLLLTLSAVLSLGILAYCKYADFLISGFNAVTGLSVPLLRMALPIGISFYTFQILSYVIDVYRGDAPAQRNLIDLAAYIAMYPQLVAGPIVRYADVAPQLRSRTHTVQDAALGARRFVLGLGKKVLLANVLYELVTVYQQSGQKTVLLTWLYARVYAPCVLRLLRLQRHGHRPGPHHGLPLCRELPLSLCVRQSHGILAALAHLPGLLVPGLCVYPPGRQPGG